MIMPFTSIATSATLAPRIEIYTTLACSIHRPDIYRQQQDILDFVQQSNEYGTPAVAHQSSSGSADISDVFMIEKTIQFTDADTPPTRKQRCASDPVVQAAVAKLTAGAYKSVFFLFPSTCTMYMIFVSRHKVLEVMPITSLCLMTKFSSMSDSHFISHRSVHGNS